MPVLSINRSTSLPLPTPRELAESRRYTLNKPGNLNPDTYLMYWQGQALVIKDCHDRPAWIRPMLRWLLDREVKMYRRLQGSGIAPEFLGYIGRDAIALEFLPAESISRVEPEQRAEAARSMSDTLRQLHEFGIFHMDLRSGGNILISDGKAHLIDFASAVYAGALLRPLRPLLRAWDRYGLRKWRQRAQGLKSRRRRRASTALTRQRLAPAPRPEPFRGGKSHRWPRQPQQPRLQQAKNADR